MTYFKLKEYADLLANNQLLASAAIYDENEEIRYLTYNSKAVVPGTLFICKGASFKAAYLEEAVKRGAVAYVSEKEYELPLPVSHLIVSDIRKAMPPMAEMFTNKAWTGLKITGFGGTKGKSTSAYYLKAIVDDYMAATGGKESAILSSIDNYDGVIREESHITTPESVELHEHFSNAVNSGITYMQMEVSSQALKYDRVLNMQFDVSVFLNISLDHISPIEHVDFEDYLTSKMKIFALSKNAVVNLDMDHSQRILEAAKAAQNVITFSMKDPSADYYAYDIHKEGNQTVFRVKCASFDETFILTMPGLFNVENAVATICAAVALNIPLQYIQSGLYRARSSGRMELFSNKDNTVIAVVDYAHNQLSFEKLFDSTMSEYPDYAITAVFGAPGGKAQIRREGLGTVAGKYADKIYLTADDPGPEAVQDICEELAVFVKAAGNCPYEIIEERAVAIHKAILECRKPTVVLIAGKGNDATQKYGTTYAPYPTDSVIAKRYLAEYDEAPFHAFTAGK